MGQEFWNMFLKQLPSFTYSSFPKPSFSTLASPTLFFFVLYIPPVYCPVGFIWMDRWVKLGKYWNTCTRSSSVNAFSINVSSKYKSSRQTWDTISEYPASAILRKTLRLTLSYVWHVKDLRLKISARWHWNSISFLTQFRSSVNYQSTSIQWKSIHFKINKLTYYCNLFYLCPITGEIVSIILLDSLFSIK